MTTFAGLYHAALGRFSGTEDMTGTDSESGLRPYGLGRRRIVNRDVSRRERGEFAFGSVGSRRHRRHLNDTLSEHESAWETVTETEEDSEEERKDRAIVRFDWEAKFVQAGREFFEQRMADASVRREAGGPRHRRSRLPKMMRRTRGAAPVSDDDDDDHLDSVYAGMDAASRLAAKNAYVRRVRAAKFSRPSPSNTAEATAASVTATSATESEYDVEDGSMKSASTPSAQHVTPIPEHHAGLSVPRHRQSRFPGQECAHALFLQLEHSVRRALTRVDPVSMPFLTELENVLIQFKKGKLNENESICATFDILPATTIEQQPSRTSAHAHDEEDTETATDDEGLVHVIRKSKSRPSPVSEAPLLLSFRGGFDRFLSHGVAQFHGLVAQARNNETDNETAATTSNKRKKQQQRQYEQQQRVLEVRLPRAGVRMHRARIVRHIQQLKQQQQTQ